MQDGNRFRVKCIYKSLVEEENLEEKKSAQCTKNITTSD